MDVIKTVGSSGQISLGKKFAGQTVVLSEIDTGVWLVKLGRFIPDYEKWMHTSEVQRELADAIDWAEKKPPEQTELGQFQDRIG